MNADTDFPFGANDETERTAFVTEADLITWRDIESTRRESRADVETIADSSWSRVLVMVARIRHPLRAWASRWVAYCTTSGTARPVRHAGKAGKACRRVELALSRLGIIDPEGFEAIEARRGSSARVRNARRRQVRGGDCNGLREFNERMNGPWIS